jgi:adenosylcobinamide-phosphate synthase
MTRPGRTDAGRCPGRGRDWPLACGLIGGAVADAVAGDPERCHPVALFGQAMTALERRVYADDAGPGITPCGTSDSAGHRRASMTSPTGCRHE